MTSVVFVPGFLCTSDAWGDIERYAPALLPHHVAWHPGLNTVDMARDWLAEKVNEVEADAYVGHSLGGLLLLELSIAERIPPKPMLIVDAFLDDPADIFKNFVWSDEALRTRVKAMLDGERPHYLPLRASISTWKREGWPDAAIQTGAHFVYGGRGSSTTEVIEALGWPEGMATADKVSIIPETSHFLMVESPVAFYGVASRVCAPKVR